MRHSFLALASATIAIAIPAAALAADVKTAYVPYRFAPSERWAVTGSGDIGSSRIEGDGKLMADFSKGAEWIGISPPDRVLLGYVDKVRLRLSAHSAGYTVRLLLRTHFMTFQKQIGTLSGSRQQEIATDGPPGEGWTWFNGENDGRLHGPLRVGEIRIESGDRRDRLVIDLIELAIDGHTPEDKRCVMVSRSADSSNPSTLGVEARCLSDQPLSGSLDWTLRSWDGDIVGRGNRPVSIPAGAEPVVLPVPLEPQPPGRKFLEASFALSLPGQEVTPVQAYWLARQTPNTDAQLRPESPFGMGIYFTRYRGPELERAATAAREAGVKWSREEFEWAKIEPEKGRYEWAAYDNLLATAKRNGISIYAIVAYWAPWTKPYTDEGIDDYVRFLRQLVRRYKKDIHQWEIWNEPNIFFWQGPRAMYATLLKRAYAAVKEEDPTAQVLGLSTAGIDFNFIGQTLAREAPFDILTIHPYRQVLEDRFFINELKVVSDLVRREDGARRPVWLTEMGWSTVTPHNTMKQDFAPNTERDQARYIARTYLCSIVSGVEPRTFWYNFRNNGEEQMYFEHEMGILRRNFEPKPAYYAFSTLTRVMQGMQFSGKVDAGSDGLFAYRFDGPRGRQVLTLWTQSDDMDVQLPVRGKRPKLVNTLGEERALTVSPDGKVALHIKGGTPSYLVLE